MKKTLARQWFETAVMAMTVAVVQPVFAQETQGETPIGEPTNPLLWLAMVTLAIGIVVVVQQMLRLKKAKREREHSSLSRNNVKTDPQ